MDTIILNIFSNCLLIFVYGFNAIGCITENNAMCCLIDSSWWTNQVISLFKNSILGKAQHFFKTQISSIKTLGKREIH